MTGFLQELSPFVTFPYATLNRNTSSVAWLINTEPGYPPNGQEVLLCGER
ncbi:hypothetical protein FHX41_5648 [Actinomadura hallensis]|uniref:Uncharacterized protein n=1 Tax=Actinomadura hallensis TaxID=337895 RepID=A0A543IMU6_9ACTN|nr:hypothetical protein FHX41_5648 [Actinomadura hallensis]